MASIDYESCRSLLDQYFPLVEKALIEGHEPDLKPDVIEACEIIFDSRTQAYREVLLGCIIAKIQDKSINIRQPYIDQGPNAFSGRTLDEKVINPFLHDKKIPSSRGPYLSVFRRSVKFDDSIRPGLRDKEGFDSLLNLIGHLETLTSDIDLTNFLQHILFKFAELREKAKVQLFRPQRLSLEQYEALISALLATPSGGRFPVLLLVATFRTIKAFFNLDQWEIIWQGINVADTASGAGGDITIKKGDQILLAVEVTERPLDRSRVVATFNTKIAPAGIEDYLFFLKTASLPADVKDQAQKYFAQGHEVNFVDIKNWILMSLITTGKEGRSIFCQEFLSLLEDPSIPQFLKISWNEQLSFIIGQ
ncbi:MAG: restriction endonuclease, SacI family [Thermodesulfobacteriota bacterium]